jgi:predicted ATP-dependent serine protease
VSAEGTHRTEVEPAASANGHRPEFEAEKVAAAAAEARRRSGRARAELLRASAVQIQRLPWLWDGWVPQVGLTVLAGEEGTGKSTVTCWLASQITHGTLDGELVGEPARVLFLTAEDTYEHIIVPRLVAAGADLDLIDFIVGDSLSLPDGAQQIAELVTQVEADGSEKVGAVVIDPISSFLDRRTDSDNESSTKAALKPLARAAMDGQFAALAVAHLNKSRSNDAPRQIDGFERLSKCSPRDDDLRLRPRRPGRRYPRPRA